MGALAGGRHGVHRPASSRLVTHLGSRTRAPEIPSRDDFSGAAARRRPAGLLLRSDASTWRYSRRIQGFNVAIGASAFAIASAVIAADVVTSSVVVFQRSLRFDLIGAYKMWSDAAASLERARRAPVPDGHGAALRAYVVAAEFDRPHPAFVRPPSENESLLLSAVDAHFLSLAKAVNTYLSAEERLRDAESALIERVRAGVRGAGHR